MAVSSLRNLLRGTGNEFGLNLGDFSVENILLAASKIVRNEKTSRWLAWGSIGVGVSKRVVEYVVDNKRVKEDEYIIQADLDEDVGIRMMRWIVASTEPTLHKSMTVERSWNNQRSAQYTQDDDELLEEFIEQITSGDSVTFPTPAPTAAQAQARKYPHLDIAFNETHPLETEIDGHPITVRRVDNKAVADEDGDDRRYVRPYIEIVCKSAEARDAVFRKLNAEFDKPEAKQVPQLYQSDRWGNMQRVRGVPLRALDTVVLKPGQAEEILADIKRFLSSEKYYTDLGIPYHHGILLHGMPGTGKTSVAAAISHALNLDVYHVALPDVANNDSLRELLRSVKPRSVLLLEEIDSFGATNRDNGPADGSDRGVTRDGLLQALDGFSAPHGLITIMTTNHIEKLDPALVRPGRIDLKVELGAVDTLQAANICKRFLGFIPEGLPEIKAEDGIAPSELIGVFKRHIYDRAAAGVAVVERLNELLLAPHVDSAMSTTQEE